MPALALDAKRQGLYEPGKNDGQGAFHSNYTDLDWSLKVDNLETFTPPSPVPHPPSLDAKQ